MLTIPDNLMFAFGVVLCILFAFLIFTNIIIVISFFKKPKYPEYKPKVSIIIPVYNESKNIKKCLNQLYSSNYPKSLYEVVVVDDGSTDDTIKIVKTFKNVKIFQTAHKGKTVALNYGIRQAKSELIMLLDADTMLDSFALGKLVAPFKEATVGATIGTYNVSNRKNLLTAFQTIEYSYNNLVRMGFSRLFHDSVWFYGAMSCYRKSVLENIGYIHSDILAEDMDIAIRLQNKGYNIVHVDDAYSTTVVPQTIGTFVKQRIRWWTGVLQSMRKNQSKSYKNIASKLSHSKDKRSKTNNKSVSNKNNKKQISSVPLIFVYISQWWWSIFAIIALPMYAIQVAYWLPYNLATFTDTFMYLFRWFSLLGPIYSIYMIPEWGINFFSIFGILSGLISVTFIIISMTIFKERIGFKEVLAIIFYFPYTLILNVIIFASVIKYLFFKSTAFIK
jgi:cellulose synthase/poly-beta-1,6-N-acetylglucosamine synthase-like glycosyltransferase